MSEGTKNQFYKYSMRTALSQNFWCTGVILMRLQEPDNAITEENLWIHVRARFDAGVASGNRKITRVGVVSSQPGLAFFGDAPTYPVVAPPDYHRYVDTNFVADADRYVDFKLDLSSLIDKSNPGGNLVYIQAPETTTNTQGTIYIWKQDGIYTTREIA